MSTIIITTPMVMILIMVMAVVIKNEGGKEIQRKEKQEDIVYKHNMDLTYWAS